MATYFHLTAKPTHYLRDYGYFHLTAIVKNLINLYYSTLIKLVFLVKNYGHDASKYRISFRKLKEELDFQVTMRSIILVLNANHSINTLCCVC